MKFKTKIKIGIGCLITGLFLTFLFLNREIVDVNLIFASVAISRALLVLAVFLAGFLVGWIAHSVFKLRSPFSKGDD